MPAHLLIPVNRICMCAACKELRYLISWESKEGDQTRSMGDLSPADAVRVLNELHSRAEPPFWVQAEIMSR